MLISESSKQDTRPIKSFNSSQDRTSLEYDEMVKHCRSIFIKKTQDYGTAWRILRLPSITDQIYIKANRIRTLEETQLALVPEDIPTEFKGILNYAVIAILQHDFMQNKKEPLQEDSAPLSLDLGLVQILYNQVIDETKALMFSKNHDYGEAWRTMRISSMTDLILMKLLRIKQIEDAKGELLISEGVRAGYQDIINYSIFALIRICIKEDTLSK